MTLVRPFRVNPGLPLALWGKRHSPLPGFTKLVAYKPGGSLCLQMGNACVKTRPKQRETVKRKRFMETLFECLDLVTLMEK